MARQYGVTILKILLRWRQSISLQAINICVSTQNQKGHLWAQICYSSKLMIMCRDVTKMVIHNSTTLIAPHIRMLLQKYRNNIMCNVALPVNSYLWLGNIYGITKSLTIYEHKYWENVIQTMSCFLSHKSIRSLNAIIHGQVVIVVLYKILCERTLSVTFRISKNLEKYSITLTCELWYRKEVTTA